MVYEIEGNEGDDEERAWVVGMSSEEVAVDGKRDEVFGVSVEGLVNEIGVSEGVRDGVSDDGIIEGELERLWSVYVVEYEFDIGARDGVRDELVEAFDLAN